MAIRRRRKVASNGVTRVIAYTRVSSEEQSNSGLGLESQRAALARECESRGWTDVRWLTDSGYSAKSLDRPAITEALALLETGQADVLLVAKVDRLSRSVADYANLSKQAAREGWSIIALDLPFDPTTASGAMMGGILSVFSEFERNLISERTRNALAAKKAQGVRLGRPRLLDTDTRARITTMHADGMTYSAIARTLNAEGIATAHGGKWWPMTVSLIANAA